MRKRTSSAQPLPEAMTSEFDGVRSLHLGSIWIQGSMRVAKPNWVELEYVQRMLAALLWLDPDELALGHAVQLGLGAGALTRFTHKVLRMRTTAVELNAEVIASCRRSFHLGADSATLQVLHADAAQWVADPTQRASVQLLQVDLYDEEAAAPVLDDTAFYADCRAVLAEGGVMSVNLFGRQASFERSVAYIAAAFGANHVHSLRPTREGNCVVLAARGLPLPERPVLIERAATLQTRYGGYGVPARKWLRMLRTPRLTPQLAEVS